MSSKLSKALRSVGAVLAGYFVIVIGTVLTFEVWLGGIGFYKSSPTELLFATIGAFLSGIAGGLAAALIAGRHPLRHAAAILIPIAIDTTSILVSGISNSPIWFDLGGSLTLLVGALVGGYFIEARQPKGERALQAG